MSDRTMAEFGRRLGITLIAVAAALLVWHTLHMFLLIFLGIILGIFLRNNGAVLAARTGMGTSWAIAVVLLVLLLIAAAAGWVVMPKIISQVKQLSDQLPDSWQAIRRNVSASDTGTWIIQHLPPMQEIVGSLGGLMQRATAWLTSFFGALVGLLIILVIGIYLAFGADIYTLGIVKITPPAKRERTRRILHGMAATLYWWLIGRIISMSIIGSFTLLGLWLLDVPLAFTLGLFAALMTFVPNIGPIISVIPAALLALQTGWMQVAYVVSLYAAIQTAESYFITPLVQRRIIAMPPALILAGQIVMGVLQGILGILVATPLIAAIIVSVKLIYIEGILEDPDIDIEAEHAGEKSTDIVH